MVKIANKYIDELDELREKVEAAYSYFRDNNTSYEDSRRFLFDTTLGEDVRATLENIGWPLFEVNTLESFVSRLAGEFAKQIPSASVRSTSTKSDDPKSAMLSTFLEGRLRYIFESAQAENYKKAMYMEALSGGFSAAKLMVDYINPYSFQKEPSYRKCYDPTLCYFDPQARMNHKGDGDFCGELVPFTEEEFKHTFPDIDIKDVQYSRDDFTGGNLHWFYTEADGTELQNIIYVADHYVKKLCDEKIVEVKIPNLKPIMQKVVQMFNHFKQMKEQQAQQAQQAPQGILSVPPGMPGQMPPQGAPQMPMQGQPQPMQPQMPSAPPDMMGQSQEPPQPFIMKTMTEEEYEVFSKMWTEHTMLPAPPITQRRTTTVTEIWHYRFIRDKLLERPRRTDFPILPIIFCDGNSHVIMNKQMTRPYFYQARDAQKMKNIVGIAMMNAIENMPQTRLLMAKETIPEEPAYQETLKNPQKPSSAIIWGSMGETNDGRPLPAPIPLNFSYFGAELIQLYNDLDKTIQMVLGNFDQQLGIQNKELSGVAIQEGATQSNNAAMPYINNYMDCMNQIASGIVQMIPKLMRTPRTVPIINKNGLHEAILINDPMNDLTKLDYNGMDIEVIVKASVNFEIQKSRSFESIATLMQLPGQNPWQGFFSGPAATDLLDNMTIRNQDALKMKFVQYQGIQQQEAAQNKQMAMMMNPVAADMFNTQVNASLKQQQMQLDQMSMQMTQQVEGMKMIQTLIESISKIKESDAKMAIEQQRIDAENNRTMSEGAASSIDAAIKVNEHLAEQFDRQAEHLYRQVELGSDLKQNDREHALAVAMHEHQKKADNTVSAGEG